MHQQREAPQIVQLDGEVHLPRLLRRSARAASRITMCSRGSSRVPRSTSNLAKTACLPLKTQALGATHLKLGNKAIMPEVTTQLLVSGC